MEENPTIENKPKPKVTMKKKLIVLASTVVAVIILLAYLLGPGWSPIASIRDTDGDGRADANDLYPNDPKNWTLGKVNFSFIIDHDMLVNDYGMDMPAVYNMHVTTPNLIGSNPQDFGGMIENSSVRIYYNLSFPIGVSNWTEIDYTIYIHSSPQTFYGGINGQGQIDAFDGQSRTIIISDYWILI
jgi:hypothetical protein